MRRMQFATCYPERRTVVGSKSKDLLWILAFFLTIALVACGDDSGTSVNDGDGGSEAAMTSSSRHSGPDPESSSSGVTLSGASAKSNGSSNGKTSSSSSAKSPSSSSSSVIPDSVPGSASSSSSVTLSPSTSSGQAPQSVESNGSSAVSSSSEYVPFDHSKTLAEDWRVGENRYKQFTDPRNGRSYYYITIYSEYKGYSVTIMAENLNIGEMVLGKDDQNDDTKIERYCYNNDTTLCDEFGGLYQWAEMMQLPSRCNTESCSDLIQPNHQGICPDGWRLFTYDDYCVVMGYKDEFGYRVKGLRSSYGFAGNNYSGFSLTGGGYRTKKGGFDGLRMRTFWFYPKENDFDTLGYGAVGYVFSDDDNPPDKNAGDLKVNGFSVRCVKLE